MPLDWGRVRLATESLKGWFLALGLTPLPIPSMQQRTLSVYGPVVHRWIWGAEAGLLIFGCLRKD